MCGQPRDLSAVQVRDLQQVAMRGRPDRLNHVAQVEAAGLEGFVPEYGQGRERGRIGGHCRPQQGAGPSDSQCSSPSISARQRSPRARSEAWAR